MDQNLEHPLIVNEENKIEADQSEYQPKSFYFLANLENIDTQELLIPNPDLSYESLAKIEPSENQDNKAQNMNTINLGRTTRNKPHEEKVDLIELYEEILMSKVFEKYFTINSSPSFETAKYIENVNEGQTTRINRILIQSKVGCLIHLISFIEEEENRTEYKTYKQSPNIAFEFYEITSDKKLIIAGNRGFIILWDCEEDKCVESHKIAFLSQDDAENVKNGKAIKNYKSQNTNDCIDIHYSIDKYIFNVKIDFKAEEYFSVKSAYCILDEEPRFLYVNIEEMIIAVITSGKDFNPEREWIHSIKIINPENMTIIDQCYPEKSYFDDVYFKISGNASCMELKVIRNLQNCLFLRNISIVSNEIEEKSTLSATFSAETGIMPEFFQKHNVMKIEDSILNSLMITYETKGTRPITTQALMDYSLTTEIKNIYSFRMGDMFIPPMEIGNAPLFVTNKLMFKAEYCDLRIFSLSELKINPKLKFPMIIQRIKAIPPFLFVDSCGSFSYYKLLLNSKGIISPRLTISDIEYINKKFPEIKKKSIIATLCNAKDPMNLKIYLDWKINNLTSENYERLPIKETIQEKTLSCTEILLQHILQIDEDFPKMKLVYEEIENNFEGIIKSGCRSVPALLEKLFAVNLEYGSPKSDYLPLYQTYDFRGSSIKGYFFGRSTENAKDYQVKNSLVKVPDILGSPNSLKVTKSLCEIEDMRIFGTDFMRTYIRSKWENMRYGILGLTLLMWLNIIVVTFLIIKDPNPVYLYIFVVVNILLLTSELIQLANLGMESYIGISNINYSSALQLVTSFCITFVYTDWYVYVLFVIFQTYTISRLYKLTRFYSLDFMFMFNIPTFGFLIIYIFTSDPSYFFFIIATLELIGYIGTFFGPFASIGLRFGFQCLSVIIFVCYPIGNWFLLSLNMGIFVIETFYLVKSRNKEDGRKTERYYNYIGLFIAEILILLSFIIENTLFGYISLAFIVPYSIYRYSAVQLYDEPDTRMKGLHTYCIRYCTYLLFAYILTDIQSFLYSFFIFNIIEFLFQREFSLKTIYEDTLRLVFNKNTIDIIRYIISFIWVIKFEMMEIKSESQDFDKGSNKYLTWIFVLLNLINALLGFRAFDQTRFYVRLIFKCVVEILPFLIIFLFFTVSFGLLNVVKNSEISFETFWENPFDQSVGGFTHDSGENLMEYIMFLLGTLIIVIIMLNLLISILGNIFGDFLIEAKLIDFKVMIETIYEVEVLIFWRRSMNSIKFFACCDHLVLQDGEVENNWDEKLESIGSQLEETKSGLGLRFERIEGILKKEKDNIS